MQSNADLRRDASGPLVANGVDVATGLQPLERMMIACQN
jgi:hypothetical protein